MMHVHVLRVYWTLVVPPPSDVWTVCDGSGEDETLLQLVEKAISRSDDPGADFGFSTLGGVTVFHTGWGENMQLGEIKQGGKMWL